VRLGRASTPGAQPRQSGQPPQGGAMNFTALAQALGVSSAKLQAAMQKTLPPPGEQASGGGPGDMPATLAKELGLSESKVQAALEQVMPQRAGGQAAPSVTPSDSTTS